MAAFYSIVQQPCFQIDVAEVIRVRTVDDASFPLRLHPSTSDRASRMILHFFKLGIICASAGNADMF